MMASSKPETFLGYSGSSSGARTTQLSHCFDFFSRTRDISQLYSANTDYVRPEFNGLIPSTREGKEEEEGRGEEGGIGY